MPGIVLGTTIVGPNQETFALHDFLGNGAFGEVYRAVGKTTGTVVAVKLLPVSELPSAAARQALLNEVRAAQLINHPNVVQVLHVEDGTSSATGPYVVMEYVSGGTLAKLLHTQHQSGTPIPIARALSMMIDIAQGTRAINEKLIHRDIKPDNILLEGASLKIADFGISKFVEESTRLHTFKGVQHMAYMAPEVWANQTNSFKIDVYSVGLVFYQILTLNHPLEANVPDVSNFLDWQKAHLYQPCADVRSLRNEVPLSVAQLLSRMVDKRPSDRPPWDQVLQILSEPSITASTTTNPLVVAAVEAVLARQREEQKQQLAAEAKNNEWEARLGLYKYSCETLLRQFDEVVEQFNRHFQGGRITVQKNAGSTIYRIPSGQSIEVSFFRPGAKPKVRGGEVIGGGWIGLSRGRSANLVLLKQAPDDLYGHWAICEIKLMALADARKLIGQFGITRDTVTPFGFKDAYFYDQIQYATGVMHVFTYTFIDDVSDFFSKLLLEACT